jgi:sarcosine oxidase subunit beta
MGARCMTGGIRAARLRREVWGVGPIDCGGGPLPTAADTVVVGGGVIGLSVALHAARTGRRVVLLERTRVGHGASGRNAGLYLPSLSPLESVTHLQDFLRAESADVAYQQTGHLALATDDATVRAFREEAARRAETPAVIRILEPAEIEARAGIRPSPEVRLGRWYAAGGQVNPWRLLAALVAACRRAGVLLRECWPVGAIEEAGAALRVVGASAAVRAPRVVVAAGAWTSRLLPAFAMRIPGAVRPAQMLATSLGAGMEPSPGMATGFGTTYWRVGPGGRLIAGGRADLDRRNVTPGAFAVNRTVQAAIAESVARADTRHASVMPDLGWAAQLDVTPDGAPAVGQLDARGRLWVACGFAGHGLPPALGIGRALAQAMEGAGEAALHPRLDPARFVLRDRPAGPLHAMETGHVRA